PHARGAGAGRSALGPAARGQPDRCGPRRCSRGRRRDVEDGPGRRPHPSGSASPARTLSVGSSTGLARSLRTARSAPNLEADALPDAPPYPERLRTAGSAPNTGAVPTVHHPPQAPTSSLISLSSVVSE